MHNSIALVTGAASGIGRGITTALTAAGHRVIATDINSAGLTELSVSDAHRTLRMDVTSTQSVAETIEDINGNEGRIDVLVNCAGWDRLMPFLETDEAFWDDIIELNYKGVLRVTHAVLPIMVTQQHGRIVNIGSDAGRVGSSLEAVYAGSKGAVIAFTKTIAREMAKHQITANVVCPGPTETPLLDSITAASDDGDRVIGSMTRGIPMRRLGRPEDIAAAVVYFASTEAAFVTGQTLSVSGGLTMA